GAYLDSPSLAGEDFLVAAEVDGRPRDSRILLAVPIKLEELEREFANEIIREDVLTWDFTSEAVVARRRRRLDALVLDDGPLPNPDPDAVAAALMGGIRRVGLERIPWSEEARHTRSRLSFLHRLDARWPDVSDDALAQGLESWLGPRVAGLR